jgi:predicted MPP superfamily phosphohydrolase
MTIAFLVLFIGLNVYLPWRLGNLLALQNKVWLFVIFGAGLISAFATMALKTRFDSVPISITYNIAWAWIGMFFFLSLLMISFEIINLIYKFSVGKPLPPIKAGLTVIILTAVLSIYSLINAASFKVANITIPIANLTNDVRIVQISDVHLGVSRSERYLAKIVQKTNELKPDFVVITGDIADSKAALRENMFAPLKKLEAPAYFVYGNHDVYVGLDEIVKRLEENRVKVLRNEVLKTNGITLAGINYMKADDSVHDPHQVSDETIKDILPTLGLSGDRPIIVLHHGPWGIEYMNEHGVDIVLAGHTHAGQLFPGNLIANTMFPYNKGLAEYKGTHMYVSQGVATYLPRMRLGTNNEINLITLTAK